MAPSIIAELCQNHMGDLDLARRMVDEAVQAGATHVKIQHIYADNLTFRPQFEEGLRQHGRTYAIQRPWKPEYERLKKLELTFDHCREFVRYVRSKGAVPVTTCFARGDIASIKEQGFSTVKIASYDCASYQMLRELSDAFDELIISTGATFSDEVEKAAELLSDHANYSFLHCVTIYPTPLDQMHLARMAWLRRLCSKVGFSDHSLVATDGTWASKAALALGADLIERHFTVLGADESKDGPVSIGPVQLKELSRFAGLSGKEQRDDLENQFPGLLDKVLGDPARELSEAELLNRDYYRGRFATPRKPGLHTASQMIFNWEETPV